MRSNRGSRRLVVAVLALGGVAGLVADGAGIDLVLVGALHSGSDVRELAMSDVARRALIWPHGVVSAPDSVDWRDDGQGGLVITLVDDSLVGLGPEGRFDLSPGRYDLDTPLLLTDGRTTLYLSSGRLDVTGGQLAYSRPVVRRNPRGDFAIVAGLLVAITVMLRAARRKRGGRHEAGGGSRRGS